MVSVTSGNHTDTILSLEKVVNRFGQQLVHDDINLNIRSGEIIGIAGGSGSGKSVLLRTMAGLHMPNRGKVKLRDKPVNQISPRESASLMGVLFQEGALFSSLTVAQNIVLPLKEHTDLNETERMELAQIKLALVGLEAQTAHKYPSQLSGGMARRAALARALAMDPMILFLDEPTSGLDPMNAHAFDEMIFSLNRGLKVTVVMVTHDLNTLYGICDRVIVLVDKNVLFDTLPNLVEQDHPWIEKFFHGPRGQGAATAARRTFGNG